MDRDSITDAQGPQSPTTNEHGSSQGDGDRPTVSLRVGDVVAYLDDVVFVLVPASRPAIAEALATGALKHRDGMPPLPDGVSTDDTFDLVRDFDAFDLSEVTDWGNLPNSTPIGSALGTELIEEIRATINWDVPDRSQKVLYDQYGDAFSTPEDLDTYLGTHDDLRLVLAVSYRFSDPETGTR
ncbi:MAG: hypothetical protein V5A34_10860 [Halapricum sp.]